MSKTDTDVIVTQYPTRYDYRAAVATIDFSRGGHRAWQLGGWVHREVWTRRRRATVARDWLELECAQDITDDVHARYKGLGTLDADFKAVLLPDSDDRSRGVVAIIEQVKR